MFVIIYKMYEDVTADRPKINKTIYGRCRGVSVSALKSTTAGSRNINLPPTPNENNCRDHGTDLFRPSDHRRRRRSLLDYYASRYRSAPPPYGAVPPDPPRVGRWSGERGNDAGILFAAPTGGTRSANHPVYIGNGHFRFLE